MSLKKLRKTNLIKYKNTGIRNTFIYTVEPEGVSVSPPPGVTEKEAPPAEDSQPRNQQKPEKIIPKVIVPQKRVPIVVPKKRSVLPGLGSESEEAAAPGASTTAASPKKPVESEEGTRAKIGAPPREEASRKSKAVKVARKKTGKAKKRVVKKVKKEKGGLKAGKRIGAAKKRKAASLKRKKLARKSATAKKSAKKKGKKIQKKAVKKAKKRGSRAGTTRSTRREGGRSASRAPTKRKKGESRKGFLRRLLGR